MDIYKERIKPLFDESGLTAEGIASLIGVTAKKIYNWNAGTKSWKNYLYQIAAAFNVSAEYLEGKTDDKNPPPVGDGLTELEKRWLQIIDGISAEQVYKLISLVETAKEMAKGVK